MENSGVVHMLKNNKTDGKLIGNYYSVLSSLREKGQ